MKHRELIACLFFSSLALAETAPVACRFPDGSTPVDQPQIHCYSPKQFAHAYQIDQVYAEGYTGKGQVIILANVLGSPTLQRDLDHFSDSFGLPKTAIQFIYPNGVVTNPLASPDQLQAAQEITLDTEWAHAIAPDATIVNIISVVDETVPSQVGSMAGLFKGIQMASDQYPGAIVSISTGIGEPDITDDDIKTYVKGSFHEILMNAANAGLTVIAATGDTGSTNRSVIDGAFFDQPNVGYPASDPFVTAVGGTMLEAGWKWTPKGNADDFWTCFLKKLGCVEDFLSWEPAEDSVREFAWKEDWARSGSGGGASRIFETPDFQKGLDPAVRTLMKGHRGVPDTALNAAQNGGVEVYTSFSGPSWTVVSGASCAAPETAGIVALAGQLASAQSGRYVGIGYLNPILYSLGSRDFNDILPREFGQDNSPYFNPDLAKAPGSLVPSSPVPGFPVTPGYDLVTGWGSPHVVNFVHDLARARLAR